MEDNKNKQINKENQIKIMEIDPYLKPFESDIELRV